MRDEAAGAGEDERGYCDNEDVQTGERRVIAVRDVDDRGDEEGVECSLEVEEAGARPSAVDFDVSRRDDGEGGGDGEGERRDEGLVGVDAGPVANGRDEDRARQTEATDERPAEDAPLVEDGLEDGF